MWETEIYFSAWVIKLPYRYDNAFLLVYKIPTFIFWLKSAIKTIVTQEIDELGDGRRTFEKIIQKVRKRDGGKCAHLFKPIIHPEAIYSSSRENRTDTKRSWCTNKKEAIHYSAHRKEWSDLQKFLVLLMTTVEIVQIGSTEDSHATWRYLAVLSVINFMPTDITRQTVDYRIEVKRKLSQFSRVYLTTNTNSYHANMYRMPCMLTEAPGIVPGAPSFQEPLSIQNKGRPCNLAEY